MTALWTDFHFLRPLWLLGVLLIPVLFVWLRHQQSQSNAWQSLVDPHLLGLLAVDQGRQRRRYTAWLVSLVCLLSMLALAGPVWNRIEMPLYRQAGVRMIVLNASATMMANDVSPDRISLARFKILDLLDRIDEGQMGLIAYTSEPFLVSPLTRDANTLTAMVPSVGPEIMPLGGQDAGKALQMAATLIERVQPGGGQILLISDDASPLDTEVARDLSARGHRIDVLAVGTREGAPIRMKQGGFLKDSNGAIVVPRLNATELEHLAQAGQGQFLLTRADNTDIEQLLRRRNPTDEAFEATELQSRLWIEMGPWLLLLMLPVVVLMFRRGGGVLIVLCLIMPVRQGWTTEPGLLDTAAQTNQEPTVQLEPEMAAKPSVSWWQRAWQRPDQIAQKALENEDYDRAAEAAEDPLRQGIARYRQDQFELAERLFRRVDSAEGHYNRGNALARLQRLEEGIAAYDQALARDPGHEDAAYNKALLEDLLKQQQQQQQQDNEDQQGDEEPSQESEESDSSEGDQQEPAEDSGDEQTSESDAETEQQQGDQGEQTDNEHNAEMNESDLSNEERQALEQWLRRVPDDPGGLLRRKFMLEHRRRQSQSSEDNNPS